MIYDIELWIARLIPQKIINYNKKRIMSLGACDWTPARFLESRCHHIDIDDMLNDVDNSLQFRSAAMRQIQLPIGFGPAKF